MYHKSKAGEFPIRGVILNIRFKNLENPMLTKAIFETPEYCQAYYYAMVY